MSDKSTETNKRPWYFWVMIFALIGALLVAGGALLLYEPEATTVEILPPLPTATDLPTATPSPLEVYVTGAVLRPQERLSLAPGTRVEDAIEAAGGAAENANLDAVNLAQRLQDGDMIFVPTLPVQDQDDDETGDSTPSPTVEISTPTPNAPRLVNINLADQAELETLPGIGPSLAGRILDYREANGPFATIEDLENVAGIGSRTIENLRPYITVGSN
ncbi:MAG: ComEA family DNA-binding protein [Chloroflexi bacterium]|nr:ComEA family DNA-binding protein [Chloroflexota bacterium]